MQTASLADLCDDNAALRNWLDNLNVKQLFQPLTLITCDADLVVLAPAELKPLTSKLRWRAEAQARIQVAAPVHQKAADLFNFRPTVSAAPVRFAPRTGISSWLQPKQPAALPAPRGQILPAPAPVRVSGTSRDG